MAASRRGRIQIKLISNWSYPSTSWTPSASPLWYAKPPKQPSFYQSFTTSSTRHGQNSHRKESFSSRLRSALGRTKIQWYSIPAGLGIGFLGIAQVYRIQRRESSRLASEPDDDADSTSGSGESRQGKPKRRARIRPDGPWSVQIMSTLPLKAMSRLWGRFNEIPLPYYLRPLGFRLYAFVFGVNLHEVEEPDLHTYPNLASFFYRRLKPGVRPLDPNPNAILSPADGKVIQFGLIESGEVEQVKGVTYSLDALLGEQQPSTPGPSPTASQTVDSNLTLSPSSPKPSKKRRVVDGNEVVDDDEEFARVNGISYTLPNLFSGPKSKSHDYLPIDQSTPSKPTSETAVQAELDRDRPWWAPFRSTPVTPTALYYCVIYLAPGDYHRFHSPVSWVVTQRRHFAGELYSVAPYLQRKLPGLFTLNERVVLLGRWRWGFFSYTPVGATNVGSIIVNFDNELRTNSLTTDTAADQRAEEAAERGEPYSGFAEASYAEASKLLGGHALSRGEEMGGFQLGSTIILVFEAPKGRRKSLDEGPERYGGFTWNIQRGSKVKVGQALGRVMGEDEERTKEAPF